jgi:hypothetical protein
MKSEPQLKWDSGLLLVSYFCSSASLKALYIFTISPDFDN